MRRYVGIALSVILVVFLLITAGQVIEVLPANEVMVIQSVRGVLHCYTQPGPYAQFWGTPTHYEKRVQYSFSAKKDQGKKEDESLRVRFAEGGHANISGVVQWEMPIDCPQIIRLHTLYGSQIAIEQQLIRPAVDRAMYMTGPHMTSYESYAARRPELLRLFEDQAARGVYETQTVYAKEPDPISGQEKTVSKVQVVMDKGGIPKYQSRSALAEFGITLLQPSFNEIKYDDQVERQIQQQQQALMQVQTAQAQAREAEQRKLTTEANGAAAAAEARWKQEVEKAQQVTAAKQRLEVAEYDTRAAEQYKRKQILEGEGDAEKRKLLMSADNALEVRGKIWLESQKYWAEAFAKTSAQLTPQFVSGPSGAPGTANAGINFMEIMGAKAARDLLYDPTMNPPKK